MLEDAFSIYLKYERNYSPLTVDRYADDLRLFHSFFKSRHPEMDWQNVTSETVRQWMMSMMEKGSKATSVNRRLSSLRSFFKFLLRKEYITEDPTLKIVGPKKEKYLPSFVKESDMNRLLDSTEFGSGFKASRDRLILLMFYLTGMRRAELIGLDVRDVDLSTSQIKVTGKRNKQRLIPFSAELKDAIHNYLQDRDNMFPDAPEAFYLDDKGKRITEYAVGNIVKKYLSQVVTLKKRTPHVLRHTFATAMLNNDAELEAVKQLLGHESLATTEIYTHTSFEELKKVYKQAHPRA
ncbi:MAG: tyrosine recombinase XerC [Bacteroidaceae bacterium]|nr:tyrosine recombinase XerC [Bacteroidaceae bacterium]